MAYELTDRMRKALSRLSDDDNLSPHEQASVRMARARIQELEARLAAVTQERDEAKREAEHQRAQADRLMVACRAAKLVIDEDGRHGTRIHGILCAVLAQSDEGAEGAKRRSPADAGEEVADG